MLTSTRTPFIARKASPDYLKTSLGLKLTGKSVVSLMRANGHTIRGFAQQMGITIARVRQVRANGVHGMAYVWDWIEALQEAPK